MKSRLVLTALVCVALASGGCGRVSGAGAADLPFYADADLTPQWSPVAHRIAPFALVTQTGAPVTDRWLEGRVHVASFVYTRCGAICPTLVRNLTRVQAAIEGSADVSIVSFTVTPETDTPAALAEFGGDRGIDPARWLLVTGDRDRIYALARQSYFADDPRELPDGGDAGAFLHTEKLVLVDRDLRLRGVYNGTAAFEIDKLIEDINRLR